MAENLLFAICCFAILDLLFPPNMESEDLSSRLQRYLLKQIPTTKALGASVAEASLEEILIVAPLTPNLNHHGTAFGGSVSAVAILSGWTLVYARLEAEGQFPGVVIQHNEIRYLKPIEGAFAARARLAQPEKWTYFLQGLSRHGRARTVIAVEVEGPRGISALFRGTYVALAVNERQ
jgi:thioesterase domain-containing protein